MSRSVFFANVKLLKRRREGEVTLSVLGTLKQKQVDQGLSQQQGDRSKGQDRTGVGVTT